MQWNVILTTNVNEKVNPMSTNFLYAQSPNRTGNQSKHTAEHKSVSGGARMLATPAGSQGAQKVATPHGRDNVPAMKQPVKLTKPKGYCGTIENDGYLKNSSFKKWD